MRVAWYFHVAVAGLMVSGPGVAQAQHVRPRSLTVFATVDGGDETDRPRSYRLYQQSDTLVVNFTFSNSSSIPIAIPARLFSSTIVFAVRIGGSTEAVAEWQPGVRRSSDHATLYPAAEEFIELEPDDGIVWKMTLRRSDGGRFAAGQYEIEAAMEDAAATIHTRDGAPWYGHTIRAAVFMVTIAPPSTPREQSAMIRLAGRRAMTSGNPADAVGLFIRAATADPTDSLAFSGLGNAYLGLNRYRAAARAYETALAIRPEDHVTPRLLALAYVGADDPTNATRVLRRIFPAAGIADELARLEELTRRRR